MAATPHEAVTLEGDDVTVPPPAVFPRTWQATSNYEFVLSTDYIVLGISPPEAAQYYFDLTAVPWLKFDLIKRRQVPPALARSMGLVHVQPWLIFLRAMAARKPLGPACARRRVRLACSAMHPPI